MVEPHSDPRRKSTIAEERLVKSAHRVMQVFEFFSERRTPLSASDIARNLGFPQSSTSMLLKCLVTLGYLDYRHETRTFRPTIRLSLLGGCVPEQRGIGDKLLELAQRLQEYAGETVLLGSQHRHFVRNILIMRGPSPDCYETPVGTLQPLSANAMGYVLLALKSETEVSGIIRRANSEEEDASRRVSPPVLIEQVAHCRARGFAYTEEGSDGDAVAMIAMLLPASDEGSPVCVAVASTADRLRPKASELTAYMRRLVAPSDVRPPVAKRLVTEGARRHTGHQPIDLQLLHSCRSNPADMGLSQTAGGASGAWRRS